LPTGDYFEGQWKDDLMHGRILIYRSGKSLPALFESGELVSFEDISSMSREELEKELLKLWKKVNQLKQPNLQDDSELN
jgi:hypothetical protein